jgi:asparagine synthase (glutamine-hydrolysing)
MAHGLEIRTPLLDFELFKALGPLIGHLRPSEGKQLLADAPCKPLPDWLRYRSKTGFNIPYGSWMREISNVDAEGPVAPGNKGEISRRWSNYVLDRYSVA